MRTTEGVNTRAELAAAALRDRINRRHMDAGVAIADPASTWIEPDVELEADAAIHLFTLLRGATRVAAGAEVGPHVVAIDAEIGLEATVGPFCYLRPGTVLGPRTKAGAFVEIKKSTIGQDTKVPHLSYIGDAEMERDQHRRRIDHRELSASARPAEGQDDDREQRPRSSGHYVRCSGHCWRRCAGRRWVPSSPTTSWTTPSPASRPGRSTRKDAVERDD